MTMPLNHTPDPTEKPNSNPQPYQDRQDDADLCGGRQQWGEPGGDD